MSPSSGRYCSKTPVNIQQTTRCHILEDRNFYVKFEVFTAVTMNNAIFGDVAPCRSCVNRRFGGTCHLHLQGRKNRERGTSVSRWLQTSEESSASILARGFIYPEDGGDTFLRNVGLHKIYRAPLSRRQHSSGIFMATTVRITNHV
jgi:hypothetical protein